MMATTRHATRLLSPRLQHISHNPHQCIRPLRFMSGGRYSNPAQRTSATMSAAQTIDNPMQSENVDQANRNPLDRRAAELAWRDKRAYHMRRIRFASIGLVLTLGGLALTLYNIDLDELDRSYAEKKAKEKKGLQMDASDAANARFQGKEIHVIGAGEGKRIVAQGGGEEVELVETGTSSVPHFPRTIHLPVSSEADDSSQSGIIVAASPSAGQIPGSVSDQEEYTLVGLGIRTVLFIQVYVVGFYIRTKDINTLQEKLIHSVNPIASTLVPGEKNDLRKKLLDAEGSREIWSELLKVPGVKTAWRISPTRNTDFGHLRDGFVNGINARTQEARRLAKGSPTEYDEEDFGKAVQSLKTVFSGGKAPKSSILILARNELGRLDVLFQPKPEDVEQQQYMQHLGAVGDERIAKLIWMGYLAGEKVSSKAAREGVVNGCITFATRPIGSVETRVI